MRIIFLNILLLISVWTSGQSFTITCESSTLETGEQAHILLKYNGKGNVTWRDNSSDADTLSKAIEVINYSKIDTIKNGDSITYSQTLMVTAWDSGYHIVSPIQILVDSNIVSSNPLLLKFNLPNINQQAPIKPNKGQLDTPFIFAEIEVMVYWLIAGFIFLVGLASTILYFFGKRKNKKVEKVIYQKPVIDSLTDRYHVLKSEKLWLKDQEKEFHTELSSILNEYLQFKYRIKSMESTSNETVQQLTSLGISNMIIKDVEHILNFSDMIKFAKQKGIDSQHEQALEVLYSFLRQEKEIE